MTPRSLLVGEWLSIARCLSLVDDVPAGTTLEDEVNTPAPPTAFGVPADLNPPPPPLVLIREVPFAVVAGLVVRLPFMAVDLAVVVDGRRD